MQRLLLASNNAHKIQEIRDVLAGLPYEILSPIDLQLALDVAETGSTFAENALLKAVAFRRASGLSALADDSGLVVDALHGSPGVYSARYGGPGLDDVERNELLLDQLKNVPNTERSARFICCLCLVHPDEEPRRFEGVSEGIIAREPRGVRGFGYDPIFYYPPLDRTFGQLTRDEKAAVSHRGLALAQLRRYLLGRTGFGQADILSQSQS